MTEAEEQDIESLKTSMMLDMYLSNEVIISNYDTVYKSRKKLLEYSAKHPEDELLVVLAGPCLYGLKGKYKRLYIERHPSSIYVIMKAGQEYWRRGHELKL